MNLHKVKAGTMHAAIRGLVQLILGLIGGPQESIALADALSKGIKPDKSNALPRFVLR